MINNEELVAFYTKMNSYNNYPIQATFVLVYNDYSTYIDDPHLEECFTDFERDEIINSVFNIFCDIKYFSSEKAFVEACPQLSKSPNNIYVYTMAQNVEGYGRRTLIPALCTFYNFININADAFMSAIGCNKKVIYHLLSRNFDDLLPTTFFLQENNYINNNLAINTSDNIVIKPISESCCIDVHILKKSNTNKVNNIINSLLDKYSQCMVQSFIHGKEIGITIINHEDNYFALQPIELVLNKGKMFLTSHDSYYENYNFEKIDVPKSLLSKVIEMSKELEFKCATRYDFKFDGKNYYLFDISPNPTINGNSSSNIAARHTLNGNQTSIFKLLCFSKIALFEPTFQSTKKE